MLITPPSTHYKIAEKVLKKQINLFIEKPVTLNSNHLKKLIKISKEKNVFYFLGIYIILTITLNILKKF